MLGNLDRTQPLRATSPFVVAVVGGSRDVLEWLQATLEPGRYEIDLIENVRGAYSQIRRFQPDLVVLCARIEDAGAFQFLTMLKLDPATRAIPVRTYTTEWEGQMTDAELDRLWQADGAPRSHRALPLN